MKTFYLAALILITAFQLGFSQSASLSPGFINERDLDGDSLLVTLTGATYDATISTGDFTLRNAPANLTISGVNREDDQNARVYLSFTGDFDTDILIFRVRAESTGHDASDLTTNSITLYAYQEPSAELSNGGVICGSGTRELYVTLTGNGPWTYGYKIGSGGTVTDVTTATSDTIFATSAGEYILTYVEDQNNVPGDLIDDRETVTIETNPTPNISGPIDICGNTNQSYQTAFAAGHSYSWEVSGGTFNGSSTSRVVDISWGAGSSGWVRVTQTSGSGCSTTTSNYTVSLKPVPPKPVISGNPGYCGFFGTTILTSSSGTSYLWSNGSSNSSITVSGGTYSVQVMNADNCWSASSDDVVVSQYHTPIGQIDIDKSTMCEGSGAVLSISISSQSTSPWNATYKDESGVSHDLTGLTGTGTTVNINPVAGTHTYVLESISDANCTGNIWFPNESITVYPAENVEFDPQTPKSFPTTDTAYQFIVNIPGGSFNSSASGAITVDGLFFPNKADTCDCNVITYTYTNANGCVSSDTIIVEVYEPKGIFVAPGSYDNGFDKYIYCYTDAPDDIWIENLYVPANLVLIGTIWTGNGITPDPGDQLKALFNPGIAGDGRHTIVFYYITREYIYDPIFGFLLGWIDRYNPLTVEFVVDYVGSQAISNTLSDEHCVNGDSVQLLVVGNINRAGVPGFEGSFEYTGPGVADAGGSGWWFNPSRAGVGATKTVTYTYTRDFSQCRITDQKTVQVHRLPTLDFNVADVCIWTDATPDSTIFINTSPDSASIVKWSWHFGDPMSGVNDSSNLMHPVHDYNSPGTKLITLTATDNNGCTDTYQPAQPIEFGEYSRAAFTWANECQVDILELTAEDDGGDINKWFWHYDDGNVSSDSLQQISNHHYDAPGNYDVQLTVVNNFNCFDSIVHKVPIRPTIIISGTNEYFEDFESGDGGWVAEKEDFSIGESSWMRNVLNGSVMDDPGGDTAWVTNNSGYYNTVELSFVEGPCFDFSQVNKPMIKFDYWVHAETSRDGAALMASEDDGDTWKVVGTTEDGINWYNSALLTGQPGGQRLGWTGVNQSAWKEARNLLDSIQSNRVRFRFAFGSDAVASNFEGFAFDNIWIGERTRMVFLEHFSNAADPNQEKADTMVNKIARKNAGELIDIHYFTNFPGADPRNAYYPAGPSSRAFYYGISTVPYSVMEGAYHSSGFGGKNGAYSWEEKDLFRQILVDPLVDIDLSNSDITGNTLNAEVKLTRLKGDVTNENLTLHLSVVENETPNILYRNVLKKMLPDVGGTSLKTLWDVSGEATISLSWNFNPGDFTSVDSLVLVAFVQNEDTKEVYQASYITFAGMLGTWNQGTILLSDALDYKVYPNPASGRAFIEFAGTLDTATLLEIYNEVGSKVGTQILEKGSKQFEINISRFSHGIYFIRLISRDTQVGVHRLVIVR